MKEYRYSIDIPHRVDRVWAIMQDYDKWSEFAGPMVTRVRVLSPGDGNGDGLVQSVDYRLPLGLKGNSIETISEVVPGTGYTYSSRKGTIGKIRLESTGENSTRLHFQEYLKLNPPFSWFESYLQKFMERYNKKTMLNMAGWLTEHPDYQPPE